MTRLIRMILPASLCGLFTGAIVLACSHRGDLPATPRPEVTAPGGQPVMLPSGESSPGASLEHPGGPNGPTVLLASQPVVPTSGPPQPGAPSPTTPSPAPTAPSPTTPSPSPTPGLPGPGTPAPGAPSPVPPGSPTTPSPDSPTTPPGTPTQTPSDAGVGDTLTPPVPSLADAGLKIDSGMSPVLQRDAR